MSNKGASREAIQFHYDLGNSFYTRMLGPSMTYSAALWSGGEDDTLDRAQSAKLDWHIAAAGLNRGQRLLDVGCGWGSLMARAAQTTGIAQATGLTLSDQQAEWIRDRIDIPGISVRTQPWQEFSDTDPHDAIISIGAIEHFARPEMNRPEKTECYSDFFAFCADNLVDGGRLSLQSITWMNMAQEEESANLPVDFFPESNLPHLIELLTAADSRFHLTRMHNRPRDYSRTLRAWVRNSRSHRDDLEREYGSENILRYQHAFTRFMFGFDTGILGLCRFEFAKR